MEAKLKSTLSQIHWSLPVKACVFSLSWLFLPFWAFFLIAVYFYLVPFFRPFKLLVPFVLTLIIAAIVPSGFWLAVFLGILFSLLLGIKNLIFVNRFENHQLMVFLLLFLVFFGIFSGFDNWQSWTTSLAALSAGISFFFLFEELADYGRERSEAKKIFIAGLGAVLIWQAASVIIFLPVNHFYQTALLFLSSVILTDILLGYISNRLDRRKILNDFSIFFVLASVILASASWGL